MRQLRRAAVGIAIGVAAIAVGDAGPVSADHAVRATGAILTGGQEVPGPGDRDGVGAAGVVINVDRARICYVLAVRKLDTVTAAHIHEGAKGVAGGIVVPLRAPVRGLSADCVTVEQSLASAIAENPSGYYVNVHTEMFPAGAIRGQLH
jgi:CHRD domain